MDVPIVHQGLDSLMEVELRLVLQRDASMEAGQLAGLRGLTPRSIAEAIVARLAAGGGSASEADPEFLAWLDASSVTLTGAFDSSPHEAGRAMRRTLLELGERMRALDPAKRRISGRAFRARIGPFCLESSFLRRAQEKPLGYPGDFMLMKQIYADAPSGAALARAVDAEVLHLPAPMAVRSRTLYMEHQLLRVCRSKSRARVASVGCGPAWELRALGERAPEELQKLDVVLLDQDTRALEESTQALEPHRNRGLSIRTLSASLTSLDDESLGASDMIYSTGLFDYFDDGEFRACLRRLYRNLEPGGRLIIGNFSHANPDRWLMEDVADWHLHYRSAGELLALAEGIAPTPARVRVEGEDRDIQLYLVIDRS
jgi:SAM-dependent methyltransferase